MEGYWFDLPDASGTLIRNGNHVRLSTAAPPWMVVDQALASITIGSRWPGQLWRVRVRELGDMSGLVAQPGYWRAAAIELLEALPLSTLFGAHGDAVLTILTRINGLTRVQAQALAQNVDPHAAAAYGQAWIRWAQAGGDTRSTDPDEWHGTLAASRGRDKERSPIHSGFLLIHTQLRQRAKAIDGDDAFVLIEEDGETEQVLSPLWQQACDALLFAAMAQGAPQYVLADEARALNRAWDAALGLAMPPV